LGAERIESKNAEAFWHSQAGKSRFGPNPLRKAQTMLDVKQTLEKRTLRTGRVEYSIQLTISDNTRVRDIIAFEFDRCSLASFQDARTASRWCHHGLLLGYQIERSQAPVAA
jgi:hypothetical protein